MIFKVYNKWQLSPVIVSFAEKSTPVWEIPFPAVTICPETKAMQKHVDFTKSYTMLHGGQMENFTVEELRNLEAVAQICDPHLFANISMNSGLKPEEIVPLLRKITMSMNETILSCKWRNLDKECESLFSEIITEEGFCYTFNVLESSELFKEERWVFLLTFYLFWKLSMNMTRKRFNYHSVRSNNHYLIVEQTSQLKTKTRNYWKLQYKDDSYCCKSRDIGLVNNTDSKFSTHKWTTSWN